MFLPYSGERGNGMANYADMIFAFIISLSISYISDNISSDDKVLLINFTLHKKLNNLVK